MSNQDIEYMEGHTPDEAVIVPTGRLTRAEIRKIPTGAHILQANVEQGGVSFSGGMLREEAKQSWIEQLEDEDEAFQNTTVFYVRPERLKDADAPLVNVPTPEEIADDRIRANYGDIIAMEDAIDSGSLDADGVRAMLIEAVKQARKGLVQNPF